MAPRRPSDRKGDRVGSGEAVEDDVLDVRRIVITGIALMAVVAACGFAALALQHLFGHVFERPATSAQAREPAHVSGVPLQPAPARDLERYRESKRATLHTYRWIDRDHGIVQIPIEEAMRMLAARSTTGSVER